MPRAGLTRSIVVAEAARLADEVGFHAFTLAAVAKPLGVALPSLYKHIGGLDALQAEISLLATRELTEAMRGAAVGLARGAALRSVASAYRRYALEHPGRYAATVRAPREGEHLAAERRKAAQQALDVVAAILAGYGIGGAELIDAARILRSALHGFADLEQTGGFGLRRSVAKSFDAMVARLDELMVSWQGGAKRRGAAHRRTR